MKKILLVFFLIGWALSFAQAQPLKIHFIDIGEGDAILIQAEKESALIDTGGLLSGYRLVSYLKENNVTGIDQLIITHPDLDHLGGIFFIIPEFKIENFYDNGFEIGADDTLLGWYKDLFRIKEKYLALKENDLLKLGQITLEVIWPPVLPGAGNNNSGSLVIMLHYKKFSCLFAADIDKAAQDELLKRKIPLAAELIKIPHHGAEDAFSEVFLKKVSPKLAVISVDYSNRRGYPAEKTLQFLEASNTKTYRTDKDGSIVIAIDERSGYFVTTKK